MELTGKRVALRPVRPDDLEGMCAWINDERATRYLGSGYTHPYTYEAVCERLENLMASPETFFAVADAETGAYIGEAGFTRIDRGAGTAEMYIVLLPEKQGNGLGTDAVALALRHAFGTLGLNRVWLRVFPQNTAAVRLYEKAGFKREGILREHEMLSGKRCDSVIMGLLRRKYEGLRK